MIFIIPIVLGAAALVTAGVGVAKGVDGVSNEHSFDERTKNFHSLFQTADRAMSSGDNQQLGLALHAIVELAKSSPFKDLADLSTVKAALDDPDHVWEL